MSQTSPTSSDYAAICRLAEQIRALTTEQRENFWRDADSQQRDLRKEVEALLILESAAPTRSIATEDEEADAPSERPQDLTAYPKEIGGYQILDVLGSGGMGVVFLAAQSRPVKRRVALKLIHTTLRSPNAQARFDVEQNALARLSHTNVAQFYEAGSSDDGFPFFAMEYLPSAEPLTSYCDMRRSSIGDRLRLFLQVCRGVQHAHQKGVLHRDLKPANILVVEPEPDSTRDGDSPSSKSRTQSATAQSTTGHGLGAIPKVIDFGLAKAFDGLELSGQTSLTHEGKVVGTPDYMSPEAKIAGVVDTRSDIYSLGIVLFELLVGRRPQGSTTLALGPLSIRRPSAELAHLELDELVTAADRRRATPRELRQQIRGDLDWIVLKTLAEEPEHRYSSVSNLAADIERHLTNEPVTARPPTIAYLTTKLVRRHRGAVAAASLILLSLIGGLVARTFEARRANEAALLAQEESQRAQEAMVEAKQLSDFLIQLFRDADPQMGNRPPQTVRELIDRGVESLDGQFSDQPVVRARFQSTLANIYSSLGRNDLAEPLLAEALASQKDHPEVDPVEYRKTFSRLATVHSQLGNFNQAKALHLQALEVEKTISGEESSVVAAVMRSVAMADLALGNLEDHERLLHENLEIQRRVLEPGSMGFAYSYLMLGFHHARCGRFEQAEATYQDSLEIRRNKLEPGHIGLANVYNYLGRLYSETGRYQEAERMLNDAAGIIEPILGEHYRLAEVIGLLGEVYRRQNLFEKAEPLLLRAKQMSIDALGEGHADIAGAWHQLAVMYWWAGRYEEAEAALQKAAAIQDQSLPEQHFGRNPVKAYLGLTLWQLKRAEEARSLLDEALRGIERSFGPQHPDLALPLLGLAGLLADEGRLKAAEDHYQRIFSILDQPAIHHSQILDRARSEHRALASAGAESAPH